MIFRTKPILLCRLCRHSDLEKVLHLQPTPVGDLYRPPEFSKDPLPLLDLDLFQCRKCCHVQLGLLVDPEDLYGSYIYTTSSSSGLREHFSRYAEELITKLQLAPGDLILEMGSNDGTLLSFLQAGGMKVLGIDPAKDIAAKATANGILTWNHFFSKELAPQIKAEFGKAKVFIANNVMANVTDPFAIVEGIVELLDDDGVFVFETGYLKHLAEDCVFDNIHHEHIDYYSVAPLVTFFAQFNLQIFDVQESTSKGSSIRVFVQQKSGKRPIQAVVQDLVEREKSLEYGTPSPYQRLQNRLETTKRELHRLLNQYHADGYSVAGYGAAIGVTTMLFHFELSGLISQLIDDNPVRHGLLSPGLNLPVVSSRILEGPNAPQVVAILSWRYAGQIMQRNAAYSQQGGKFLRILPQIELV